MVSEFLDRLLVFENQQNMSKGLLTTQHSGVLISYLRGIVPHDQ